MDHAPSRRPDPGCPDPPVQPRLAPASPPLTPLPASMPTAQAWALVAPHRARLIAAARARGLSLPDAQDAAHHVMCRAVERGVTDPARVEAVLVKAVAARCQEVAADAERRERALARTRSDDRLAGAMEEAVCDRAQVRWLLGKLPARERDVVVLSVAGETVTGIAAATGLSYPTVDRLLSRARKELRRLAAALGVAGLAVWRHRKVTAPSAAAVALAGVTLLAYTPAQPAPVVAPPPAGAVAEPLVRHRAPVPFRKVVGPRAVAARAVRAAPAPAALPPAVAPPRRTVVDTPDVVVDAGDETYLERIEKCLENGIVVEVGATGSAIVCAEELALGGAPGGIRP